MKNIKFGSGEGGNKTPIILECIVKISYIDFGEGEGGGFKYQINNREK